MNTYEMFNRLPRKKKTGLSESSFDWDMFYADREKLAGENRFRKLTAAFNAESDATKKAELLSVLKSEYPHATGKMVTAYRAPRTKKNEDSWAPTGQDSDSPISGAMSVEEARQKPTDMLGLRCRKCRKDKYTESSQFDDMDGCVTCSCGHRVARYPENHSPADIDSEFELGMEAIEPAVDEGWQRDSNVAADTMKMHAIRYHVFAGKDGRLKTKIKYFPSADKMYKWAEKAPDTVPGFYEIDGYSYPQFDANNKRIDAYGGMDESAVEEGKWFRTTYGWAGGAKPGGGTYKHPEIAAQERKAKRDAKKQRERDAKAGDANFKANGGNKDPSGYQRNTHTGRLEGMGESTVDDLSKGWSTTKEVTGIKRISVKNVNDTPVTRIEVWNVGMTGRTMLGTPSVGSWKVRGYRVNDKFFRSYRDAVSAAKNKVGEAIDDPYNGQLPRNIKPSPTGYWQQAIDGTMKARNERRAKDDMANQLGVGPKNKGNKKGWDAAIEKERQAILARKKGLGEGDVIQGKFGTKQAQKAKDQYKHSPDVAENIPKYDPKRHCSVLPEYCKGHEIPFDSFIAEPINERTCQIIGVAPTGETVECSRMIASLESAKAYVDAMNRKGFSSHDISKVKLGEGDTDYNSSPELIKFSMLQAWHSRMVDALNALGLRRLASGYESGSTVWSIVFDNEDHLSLDQIDKILRDQTGNYNGWMRLAPHAWKDDVEEDVMESRIYKMKLAGYFDK